MDASDRRLQVKLTQKAKIATGSSFIRAIFAFAGFVSTLKRGSKRGGGVAILSGVWEKKIEEPFAPSENWPVKTFQEGRLHRVSVAAAVGKR